MIDVPLLVRQAVEEPCFHMEQGDWFKEYCGIYYSPYYSFLAYVAQAYPNALAVELGVEKGRASAAMALGMGMVAGSTGAVYGFDTIAREELKGIREKFPRFVFFQCASSEGFPVVAEGAAKCDMKLQILHVDTEHSYSMAKMEFELYEPLLADGAIVCFDDTHAAEDSVLGYVKTLDGSKGKVFYCDELHTPCGYAVLVYRSTDG